MSHMFAFGREAEVKQEPERSTPSPGAAADRCTLAVLAAGMGPQASTACELDLAVSKSSARCHAWSSPQSHMPASMGT